MRHHRRNKPKEKHGLQPVSLARGDRWSVILDFLFQLSEKAKSEAVVTMFIVVVKFISQLPPRRSLTLVYLA
ncbi:MAG: hypothetical protein QOI53_1753 [Verrucomicrobiota bacterium]|jgi:hypothetical protein|nr:hypothetical protein [Verrucomicrobiota bacterium]